MWRRARAPFALWMELSSAEQLWRPKVTREGLGCVTFAGSLLLSVGRGSPEMLILQHECHVPTFNRKK